MSRYSDDDRYIDPAFGGLKNLLGIADAATLEQAEADFVAARSRELSQTPLEGRFDLAHLQAIHHYLFGDVYEWAGQLRSVDISKGANRFALYAHIHNAAAPQLAKENHLAGPDASGELNALHPFREGNGRALREFISHLAHANGYYIAWENMSQKLAALIRQSLSAPGV